MYRIAWRPAAERAFLTLPNHIQRLMQPRIDALTEEPRPPGCKKLSGQSARYRIRVGDYRLVYEIRDRLLLVLVVHVGHRRDVYRGL